MKTIDTLVPDIYHLLRESTDHEAGEVKLGTDINTAFTRALGSRELHRKEPRLWASEYGDRCARRVYYKVHHPEDGEPLEPHTRFKFLYGDVLESTVLELAREAGHSVECEQERVEITSDTDTSLVSGRIDAVIDGHVVDVKSMSTYAFNKYKKDGGLTLANDTFGYVWQLALYHYFRANTGGVAGPPYILAIDKQNGHIALFPVLDLPTPEQVKERVVTMYDTVFCYETTPGRGFDDVPDGKSGNRKLDVSCSYCAFKEKCWPGLRTFLYSNGPVFLTNVVREPNVPEVTKDD